MKGYKEGKDLLEKIIQFLKFIIVKMDPN